MKYLLDNFKPETKLKTLELRKKLNTLNRLSIL